MGSKVVKRETWIADRTGFYEGKRIRIGDDFTAPAGEKISWAHKAGDGLSGLDAATEIAEAENGGSRVVALLDQSQSEVANVIPSLTDHELQAFIDAESGGKRRKGVLKLAEDERQNRVGRIGGTEERAKQPEEKDPLPADPDGPLPETAADAARDEKKAAGKSKDVDPLS